MEMEWISQWRVDLIIMLLLGTIFNYDVLEQFLRNSRLHWQIKRQVYDSAFDSYFRWCGCGALSPNLVTLVIITNHNISQRNTDITFHLNWS